MKHGTGKRHILPPRARAVVRVLLTAAAVALLAIGIGIASNIMDSRDVVPAPVQAPAQPGSSQYRQALDALRSGDTSRAVQLLEQSAAAGNAAAKSKLSEVSRPTTATPSTVASSTFTSKVADMAQLLPASVAGYDMARVETSPASGIVAAAPAAGGPSASISRIVFAVYDKKTASKARSWLVAFDEAYPKNASTVKVADVSAAFGTDGAHLAAVSFVRGRYGFEVVATAVGNDPKAIKALVLKAAASLSAAHE